MPSVVVCLNIRQLRVSSSHFSHVLCFCSCDLKRFFVALSLAVFNSASAFNQDVSKWNTGAVTSMRASKCTLSSLSVATPSAVVYFEYSTSRVSSDHNSHTICYFWFCVFETVSYCWLWWVGLSFLCCTLSCSVLFGNCVQSGHFQMGHVSSWQCGIYDARHH